MRAKRNPFDMQRFFQALGDITRMRLLNLIGDREICVCYLVEVLRQPQPKISRHLAYLRSAGIVTARREGRWMHYKIATVDDPGAASVLRETLEWLQQQKSMRADRQRLALVCCAPSRPVLPVPAKPKASAHP